MYQVRRIILVESKVLQEGTKEKVMGLLFGPWATGYYAKKAGEAKSQKERQKYLKKADEARLGHVGGAIGLGAAHGIAAGTAMAHGGDVEEMLGGLTGGLAGGALTAGSAYLGSTIAKRLGLKLGERKKNK